MKDMSKLLNDYVDMFGENFPIFMCMGMSDQEIIDLIETSIKNGEPYTIEMEDDALY